MAMAPGSAIKALCISACVAFSSVTSLVSSEVVRIVVDSENPPASYLKDGRAEGIFPELFRAAFKKMGVPVEVTAYPWKRCLQMGETGAAGIGGIFKTPGRGKIFDYSAPLYPSTLEVYVKKGCAFPFNGIPDLKNKTIGCVLPFQRKLIFLCF